jgi:hypothetical protein
MLSIRAADVVLSLAMLVPASIGLPVHDPCGLPKHFKVSELAQPNSFGLPV